MRMIRRCALVLVAGSIIGCDLDLRNPNAPGDTEVTTTTDGVIALATGLQARFSTSYFSFAYMAGLVTDELAATTAAFISISDAEQGSVPPGTGVSEDVFRNIYRTVRSADDLLVGTVALADQFEPGTRSGLRALAFALKAESLGEALQSYQRIPVETYGVATPQYVGRAEALTVVRALLDSAATEISTTPPSALFNNSILTPGVSLPNMIQLFRARYARIANDNATALAASNLVARTGAAAFSLLTYPGSANPFNTVTGGTNGVAPRRGWRLSMETGDQRVAWFVDPQTTLIGRIQTTPLDLWRRYAVAGNPFPVYFPDEALLIKAEALANTNALAQAQAVLDSVRTDCTGGRGLDDPKACLAPLGAPLSQAALLAEIYKQRRYELFATGARWEDSRRRSLVRGPVAAPSLPLDAQRCWLPYAVADRNANPNVPPDPAEPTSFPSGCPLQ